MTVQVALFSCQSSASRPTLTRVNLLYPTFSPRLLPRMFGIALIGGLLAGLYGVIHDQITYTISPDYFTQVKFYEAFVQVGYIHNGSYVGGAAGLVIACLRLIQLKRAPETAG